MKIKHYPGKAVANDPYLDMDATNPTMNLLYEASWLDAQRSLSSSSSGSNSWDRHSTSSNEIKVHQYSLQENYQKNKNSKSRRYHSDQYLSRIAPKRIKTRVIEMDSSVDDFSQNYYLPSQTKYIRQQSKVEEIPDFQHLSLKNEHASETNVKYRNVINDLQVHLVKKSVRFHDKSEEIGVQDSSEKSSISETDKTNKDAKVPAEKETKLRLYENPLDDDNLRNIFKSTTVNLKGDDIKVDLHDKTRKDSEEVAAERVNDWINDQNSYIVSNSRVDISDSKSNSNSTAIQCEARSDDQQYDKDETTTNFIPQPKPRTITKETDTNGIYSSRIKPRNQTDEEFYDHLVNSRQRLPASKNGFKPELSFHQYENEEVIQNQAKEILTDLNVNNIYKDANKNNVISERLVESQTDLQRPVESQNRNDFLIPRPKLIVPVHTYAVRKRRTGNLRVSLTENNRVDANCESDTVADCIGKLLLYIHYFTASYVYRGRVLLSSHFRKSTLYRMLTRG